ncbi:unnamed protein product [Fraxinus pennsylvanica]|uniref:glucan endo-1,3-beta-D-glucosidase n=1 Tax=Fraxinus pennsylvanica TaxID=56036 RepID=A0AAD1Z4S5_9LAMI|nr:unnamed protein product [Fraxinus pennsylvanica]
MAFYGHSSTFFFSSFLFLFLSNLITLVAPGSIGVNYGRVANNLPSPPQVVQLLKAQGLTKVKIFDTDSTVLSALSGSGISVTVALINEQLSSAAADQSFTDTWVRNNILTYLPNTLIEAIAVGNEVTPPSLVPAMKNIYASLLKYDVASKIKVSSPLALRILQSSYPPSSGSFKPDLIEPVFKPMLNFLRQTGSYFMINVYPFFAYSANTDTISLDYALFQDGKGVTDPNNGLVYKSLFEAQLDAVYASINALGFNDLKMVVTETGWPSNGDGNENGANIANAAKYNGNVVRRVLTGGGTPLRPNEPLNVYIFALFNENQKDGRTSERNFGLFYPNQDKVYDIPLTLERAKSTMDEWIKDQVTPSAQVSWCVAKGDAGQKKLQEALDYACGQGAADCRPIQKGGTCYDPNTLEAHASYAFNSYYQKNSRASGTCDFGGTAKVVGELPKFGNCEFSAGEDSVSKVGQTWCVANSAVGDQKLQAALDYACGEGNADCGPIQKGATCYEPNTLEAHASYAFNSYYQKNSRRSGTCNFGGAGKVVTESPKFGNCEFSNGEASVSKVEQTWCVANSGAGDKKLQEALDYACGQGRADCGPIQKGATCYEPNTLEAHASYAFNNYYQKNSRRSGTCDFGGAAKVVTESPKFGNCESPAGDVSTSKVEQTWCVANSEAGEKKLQAALDYACGEGKADCGPIQNGAICYNPNTLEAHASYAFNSYYQKNSRRSGTCDFNGAAKVVSEFPKFGNCEFPTGASSASNVGQTWCVANSEAGEKKLQAALDYACGEGGADCRPIQEGSTCYDPNTLEAHASYAFNSYYQKNSRKSGTCDFGGAATVVTQSPSEYSILSGC